ncbi:MAG: nucleoside triphosphate pyrophosphohydrolase [Gammaproteobacteria bacterium]|nr:nucleoside triphosphate pyrophosphohydrolase [Gammaproteobacteria bacterium]
MSEVSVSRAQRGLGDLLSLMRRLRDPASGCPWDAEQTFATIASYTVEEAYEVADAINRQNHEELLDELGDLLFQVVFHARIAEEQGLFDFADVARAIVDKMVRRHPHVFADAPRELAGENWEVIKAQERRRKGAPEAASALAGITRGLPPIKRAVALQKRAAKTGFDWPGVTGPAAKLSTECDELNAAIREGDTAAAAAELGDVFFTAANIARHLRIDPDQVMMDTNARFESRFRAMEANAPQAGLAALDDDTRERLWEAAKRDERGS